LTTYTGNHALSRPQQPSIVDLLGGVLTLSTIFTTFGSLHEFLCESSLPR